MALGGLSFRKPSGSSGGNEASGAGRGEPGAPGQRHLVLPAAAAVVGGSSTTATGTPGSVSPALGSGIRDSQAGVVLTDANSRGSGGSAITIAPRGGGWWSGANTPSGGASPGSAPGSASPGQQGAAHAAPGAQQAADVGAPMRRSASGRPQASPLAAHRSPSSSGGGGGGRHGSPGRSTSSGSLGHAPHLHHGVPSARGSPTKVPSLLGPHRQPSSNSLSVQAAGDASAHKPSRMQPGA